jgi:pimeloyl-ACP methyl ester carboxylesterase
LFDGDTLTGKLDLPSNKDTIKEIVIFIPGTGPNTYINRRGFGTHIFNYFDLFVKEFNKRGIAFFAYNTRGVDIGNKPPYYDKVDRESKYKKYLPGNCVKDIESMINYLKADERLKKSKVILLGWSEGTILAAMAADEYKDKNIIDALFLAGFANDNMFDIVKRQHSGESQMILFRKYFDTNNDSIISKEEFLSKDIRPTLGRMELELDNSKKEFKKMDVNSDNKLTAEDFKALNSKKYDSLIKAINKNDDEWIWKKYVRVTSAWCKEHFQLEPNKTRLLRIDIPIYIFHGEEDANCPVEGVNDIKNRFAQNNKTNLQCFIFKGEDHDLNYIFWIAQKKISKGIQKIFDISEALNK